MKDKISDISRTNPDLTIDRQDVVNHSDISTVIQNTERSYNFEQRD